MTKGEGASCTLVIKFAIQARQQHLSSKSNAAKQKRSRFSKRQYPIALAFVSRYERQKPNSTTDQLRYLSDSSKFIKDCKTEENIRAAKTMRYWGTGEVGDWHYTNLKEMGADNYKSILSLRSRFVVYTTREKIEGKISDLATEIASKNFVPKCDTVVSSKNWAKLNSLKMSILITAVDQKNTIFLAIK